MLAVLAARQQLYPFQPRLTPPPNLIFFIFLRVLHIHCLSSSVAFLLFFQSFYCLFSYCTAAPQAVGEHNYAAWSVRVMAGKFQYARNNLVAFSALIADMKALRRGALGFAALHTFRTPRRAPDFILQQAAPWWCVNCLAS